MKIDPVDLRKLRTAIEAVDTKERRAKYIARDFPRAELVKNLDMRYRWDLLHACGLKIGDGVGIKGDLNLYGYMNDTHIDTALRSIVPPLEG